MLGSQYGKTRAVDVAVTASAISQRVIEFVARGRRVHEPFANVAFLPADGERTMARFFFNVLDGQAKADQPGTELPGVVAARSYAMRVVGEALQEDSTTVWQSPAWHVEVTDDRGLVLFDIHVIATGSPAVQSGQ